MGETAKRIISGFTLGFIVAAGIYWNDTGWGLFPVLFVTLFSYLGLFEYYALADRGYDGRPIRFLGVFFTFVIILAFHLQGLSIRAAGGMELPAAMKQAGDFVARSGVGPIAVLLFLMMTAMSAQLLFRPLDGSIYSVSTTVMGVLYAVVPIAHALLLLSHKNGVFYLVFVVMATIMTDTGAYFAGKYFGKHNAGLKVSPRKTYEGYVGGFVFAILINVGFVWGWKQWAFESARNIPLEMIEVIGLTAVLSVVSVFGDLVESAIKRDAKKKDSASLIPGHGGMLDLDDALLFTLPLGTYFFHFKFLAGFAL